MKNIIEKIILVALLAMVLGYAFNLRMADINNSKNKNAIIMESIAELSGKNTEDVRKLLGKEKSIHKNKVYTYEDSIAKYNLLIVDDIENVVISFKKEQTRDDVYKMIAIKADMIKEKSLAGEDHYKVIDKDSKMEVTIVTNKEDKVKRVKVQY